MTIFDLFRYPIAGFEDAVDLFPRLPEPLRKSYMDWYHKSPAVKPNAEQQLTHLRKLIGEYDDDI